MRIATTKPLFAWECLEDSPTLRSLRELLDSIPDAALLAALRKARGRGRNDYPIHVLWRTLVISIACRHTSMSACLDELRRNPSLRQIVGIESEDRVPRAWNMSRFEQLLGQSQHYDLLHQAFSAVIQRLGTTVPDLGVDTAGDATALHGRRPRGKDEPSAESTEHPTDALPQPNGGQKTYTDQEGRTTEVFQWFGYKLHLVVDTKHEVAIGYQSSSANQADCTKVPDLLDQMRRNLPDGRVKTFAYDKAADTQSVHERLRQEGIKPLIQVRHMWDQQDQERPLPMANAPGNVVHDEAGTVYCYDTTSDPPVRHRMAYMGYEADRDRLKYRCPAVHEGWRCPNHQTCNAGRRHGLTVRVKPEIDPRRFPEIPRATKQFERLYKNRTSVERTIGRLKVFWGADDGNVTGSERFHARIGTVMLVHAVFAEMLAAAPRYEGRLGQTRLSPIAQALRERRNAAA